MKEFRNPIFDLGIISIIIFLIGIFVLGTNTHYGYIILFTGVGLGIIFTFINIVGVVRTHTLKGERKIFWLMIVLLVPVLGSFIYYIFTKKNEKPMME
ncbi:MAG: PLDc N-terminal domain-containing protein [Bacteroidota bacterium]|nr:PLDc N-terminal domain-containing protein [Bacteroidota bacterium]